VTSGRSFQAIGPALVAWTARLYNMTDDLGVKTMLKGRPARNLVPGQAGRLRTAELRTSDQAAGSLARIGSDLFLLLGIAAMALALSARSSIALSTY
jgi:hypothetical protein